MRKFNYIKAVTLVSIKTFAKIMGAIVILTGLVFGGMYISFHDKPKDTVSPPTSVLEEFTHYDMTDTSGMEKVQCEGYSLYIPENPIETKKLGESVIYIYEEEVSKLRTNIMCFNINTTKPLKDYESYLKDVDSALNKSKYTLDDFYNAYEEYYGEQLETQFDLLYFSNSFSADNSESKKYEVLSIVFDYFKSDDFKPFDLSLYYQNDKVKGFVRVKYNSSFYDTYIVDLYSVEDETKSLSVVCTTDEDTAYKILNSIEITG